MTGIQQYLLAVCATAILVSLLCGLLSSGRIKNIAAYTGGMVLILVMLAPILRIDNQTIENAFLALEHELDVFRTDAAEQSYSLYAARIKQETEEYILDKTASMGINVTVDITVGGDALIPVPIAVTLKGDWTDIQRKKLTNILENDLGIKREAQTWESS